MNCVRIKFQDLTDVRDEHTQSIVELVRHGKREEAFAAFYRLCFSICDCEHTEMMLLSQRIHEQARAA